MNPLLTFGQIAELTQGRWLNPPEDLTQTLVGGTFDSRATQGAEIFFTLPGASDAHAFLPSLEGSGVKLALVSKEVPRVRGLHLLWVEDVLTALHLLARHQAKQFRGKIIALTGSSGKTTAKTWLAYLLKPYYSLIANPGNFNNHIGCPLTVLAVRPETEILILEMGTNNLGELALLSRIAPADFTLLLNVGHAHLGRFGSLEKTYQAKMEIFSHQRPGGLAIVPAEDTKLMELSSPLKRVSFGEARGEYAYERLNHRLEGQEVRIKTPQGERNFFLASPGYHAPATLTALMPLFCELGLFQKLPDRLELPTEKGRGGLLQTARGAILIDDTYNANPESVINLLYTLTQLPGESYVAVIGNLGELEEDLSLSAEVIAEHIPKKLDHLLLTGGTGVILAQRIQQAHPLLDVRYYPALAKLLEDIKSYDEPGAIIGVKGSRAAHMERVILRLQGKTISCLLSACERLTPCSTCEENHGFHDPLG